MVCKIEMATGSYMLPAGDSAGSAAACIVTPELLNASTSVASHARSIRDLFMPLSLLHVFYSCIRRPPFLLHLRLFVFCFFPVLRLTAGAFSGGC